MPSAIQDPPPHDMQLDAGHGLLAAAARCALLRILCISPVMGLTDRKRLVQQLTQNETSAELPCKCLHWIYVRICRAERLLWASCLGSTLLC
jgi:hypothetical protein